jgi:hypothetical protein
VTEIAADVLGGIEAFWIEAVGVDLVAAVVVVALIDSLLQLPVEGMSLTEVLAEQVAPFGGQTVSGQPVDLYPLTLFQAAFDHHQVDVGFEAHVAAGRVESVEHANTHAGVDFFQQFSDGLGGAFEEHFQERAVGTEDRPEEIVDGESDVEVWHVEEVTSDIVDPVVDADLAAGGTEAGLAGEGDTAVESTAGADVAGIAAVGVAAEDHAFDALAHVGALVWRDLAFEAQVAPGVPVLAEDAPETVMGSGTTGVAPGGES